MKILVTGGAGFIGSNLSIKLSELGHDVTVIDNLDDYYSLKLKRYNIKKLKANGINIVRADLRDPTKLEIILKKSKPDYIYHLAAKAGVRNSIDKPEEYFAINVLGTLHLLQAAKRNGVRKVMIASSSSVYGNNSKVPFSEEDLTENQVSPYASSKKAMEVLCKMYNQVYDLDMQIFRFFTVYGPSGRPDMAPVIFTKSIALGKPIKIFGNLETQRDYTFIDDILDGLIGALKVEDKFEIYNLGNNTPVLLGDFISAIEKGLGGEAILEIIPFQRGDVERTWADINKAKENLKFNPKTTIDRGMKKFTEWFLMNKNLYS